MSRNDPNKVDGDWMREYCVHLVREHGWTQKRLVEYFSYYLREEVVINLWRVVNVKE